MPNSRSKASRNKVWLAFAALVLVAGFATRAHAERKRVVVLPFEGDEKAEKFHAAVIKLLKKSHTVVSTEKWETTAENLSAAKVSDKNIKKVAKKMKVDGVVEGTVTKRRDAYMIKLKLRSGTNGSVTASVDTKAEGTKLDGQASRDIKDELIEAIDGLESVRASGGGDDEEEKPKKAGKKGDDEEDKPKKGKKGDDEEDKPKKGKKGDDEEEQPKKSKFGGGTLKEGKDAKKEEKKDDEETALKTKKDDEEEEDKPKKPKKGGKEVAVKGEGEEISEKSDDEPVARMTGASALTPANRAIDATVGLSLNARRLAWQADADLPASTGEGNGKPPNYNGVPAPGAVIDITAYPLAFGHKKKGILNGIGVTGMFDRALLISSQKNDGTKLKTASARYQFGAVFRYPLGASPNAVVVGGRLVYGRQSFQIQQGADLPNVNYTAIEPGAFVKIPMGKLVFNADLGYQLISNTGQMNKSDNYGKGTVAGLDVGLSADYAISSALFARAGVKIERIAYKFDGSGMLTTGRDTDPEQDVKGATDMYLGAAFTVGYLY